MSDLFCRSLRGQVFLSQGIVLAAVQQGVNVIDGEHDWASQPRLSEQLVIGHDLGLQKVRGGDCEWTAERARHTFSHESQDMGSSMKMCIVASSAHRSLHSIGNVASFLRELWSGLTNFSLIGLVYHNDLDSGFCDVHSSVTTRLGTFKNNLHVCRHDNSGYFLGMVGGQYIITIQLSVIMINPPRQPKLQC